MTSNNKYYLLLQRTAALFCFASVAGCAGFSLQSGTSAGGTSGAGNPSPTNNSASSSADRASPSAAVFDEVSDDDNKKLARDFKVELRLGEIARLFGEDEVFSSVEALCGTKVWDQCQIAYSSERNDLDWPTWSFKRRDQNKVYQYPEMFYEQTESLWSEQALHKLSVKGEDAALFIKMVSDKCGQPFDSGCEVRARKGQGTFRLTVRESGEVIELMSTLNTWKEDM